MSSALKKARCGLSIISVFALGVLSCASINQTLLLAPLPPSLPVSASPFIIVNGQILSQQDYTVLQSFKFEKSIRCPLTSKQITFDLSKDLNEIAGKVQADAITDLSIRVKNVQHCDISWVLLEGGIGSFIFAAETYSTASALIKGDPHWAINLNGLGLGAAILGVCYLHYSVGSNNFILDIAGNAVKMN